MVIDWRGCRTALDPVKQLTEVSRFNHVKTTTSVFGWIAVRVEGLADKGSLRIALSIRQADHGDHLIDNAGQFQTGFAAPQSATDSAAD